MPTFSYEAQTPLGQSISGYLTATDQEAAVQSLQGLQLRILAVAPQAGERARARVLSGADFQAFNQQLAYLASAGMPVEQGLRLIAQDVRSGRLASTIRAVADDLDRGVPLPQAFACQQGNFPAFYATLVEAGIKANNLPAMLMNLGRHLELLSNLRAALWRATAYPLVLFVGLLVVLTFISLFLLPPFEEIFRDFRTAMPKLTVLVLAAGPWVPPVAIGAIIVCLCLPLVWGVLHVLGIAHIVADFILPIPLIGPILRRNMLARWCDALQVAVSAGMDLPRALDMAARTVASPRLSVESAILADRLAAGRPLTEGEYLWVVPPTVVAAIQLGSDHHDLPTVLGNLAELYQAQARERVALVPAILTPILMVFTGTFIGFLIIAMFLPLVRLIQNVSGP